ncbi:MAG: zinc-binding dehydrogenase, partial [Rhodanobacter sp.]
GQVTPAVAKRRLGGPNDGVMSEYLCIGEHEAVRAPRHLGAEEAATLPVSALTAWHSLFCHGTVKPGDVVMVQGAGGVSTAAVQFAAAAGAYVVSVLRDDRHAQCLQSIGARNVVFSNTETWTVQVIEATGGRGADVVVDVVGSTLAQSIAVARVGGLVHLVGYVGSTRTSLDIFDAIRHAATIRLATAGPRTSFEAMVRAMELHRIRPPEPQTLPVARWREGFERLAKGGHVGKIVLTL